MYAIQTLITAISLGGLYAVISIGVALVFSVLRLVNFAHASLLLVGAYAIYFVGSTGSWQFIPVVIVATVITALLLERVAFRPLRGADLTTLMVASFGISTIVQDSAQLFAGSVALPLVMPAYFTESFSIGPVVVQNLSVITVVATGASLGLLALFLQKTRVGLHMRAAAENLTMARMLGVKANEVIAAAFLLSALLASVASILLAGQGGNVTPTFGFQFVLVAFMACVVGGMGSLSGAAIGGLILGVVTTVFQAILPVEFSGYRDGFVYLAVILILLFRPQGIRGTIGRLA